MPEAEGVVRQFDPVAFGQPTGLGDAAAVEVGV
jgi:hypothetical protein